MILSRNQIKKKWENKEIQFEPDIKEDQIQLCSINLRVGNTFNITKHKKGHIINPSLTDSEGLFEEIKSSQGKVTLKKNDFLLATTHEYIKLPNDLAALVEGRSTFARYGLSAHITAPLINPGFYGNIILEIYHHGETEVYLEPTITQICQLIFLQVTDSLDQKIVESLSKYKGQKSTTPKPDENNKKISFS